LDICHCVDHLHVVNAKCAVWHNSISVTVLYDSDAVGNNRRFKMREKYGSTMLRSVNGAGRPKKGFRVVRLLVRVETAAVLEKLPKNQRGEFVDWVFRDMIEKAD